MNSKLILSILCLLVYSTSFSGVVRVNKNAGTSADFTSLQAAIDSSSGGDTIYLEPSGSSYGSITINKRVNIYGPGPLNFQNPGLQATTFASKVTNITMDPGGELSGITGIEIQGTLIINTGSFAVTRCYFSIGGTGHIILTSNTVSAGNILIAQCYMEGEIRETTSLNPIQIQFYNNYINSYIVSDPNAQFEFVNNVMIINITSVVRNSIFTNNIITPYGGTGSTFVSSYNNSFYNNITTSTTWALDTADGNVNNQSSTNIFVGTTGNSLDGQWQLKSGSPAIDAGLEIPSGTPTDIGMFGGPSPYQLGGVPALPTIYELVVPASNTTGQLNVTIKARAQE